MGFDVNRFQGTVDEELLCSICSAVLEDPVQVWYQFLTPTYFMIQHIDCGHLTVMILKIHRI